MYSRETDEVIISCGKCGVEVAPEDAACAACGHPVNVYTVTVDYKPGPNSALAF